MNTIAAINRRWDYYLPHLPHVDISSDEPPLDYLDIAINGRPLNEVVGDVLGQSGDCLGLVPCLLPWHDGPEPESDRELEISFQRFLPAVGDTAVAPVLMCSEDCDFHCSVVIAEIFNEGSCVRWSRIGWNDTHWSVLPDGVGSTVKWAESFAGWEFDAAEYRTVLDAFQALRASAAEPDAPPDGGPETSSADSGRPSVN